MGKQFDTLTKEDVEKLRNKPICVPNSSQVVEYNFTNSDVQNAKEHLENIYQGTVRQSFAAKILLLNEIYNK